MKSMDSFYIHRVLRLAKRGLSWTFPNPLVGAVLVKNGNIIGVGYHAKYGEAHAEINAIHSAKEDISGSTLYVNLEPCCHMGKTGPCVDEIIKVGLSRVVFSHLDPNPFVAGKGKQILQKAGVEVVEAVMKDKALQLNEGFITFHTKKRPFVAVKFASSLDGKIAATSGDSKWITNEKSRAFARRLRAQYQAILVGKNTVLKDDPHLGCRDKRYKDPVRIILDSHLSLDVHHAVFRDDNVIVAATKKSSPEKRKKFLERGITVLLFDGNRVSINQLIETLGKQMITSILVEGGAETIGSFFDAKLVDKAYVFYAPIIIGGKHALSAIGGKGVDAISNAIRLRRITRRYFGDDILMTGYTG